MRLAPTPIPIISVITAAGVAAEWNASDVAKNRMAPGPITRRAP